MRGNVHAQDTRGLVKSQDILRTTTIVYDIRHARVKRRVRGNSTEEYADVYAFISVNVIHLCKLHRLHRLQDKHSRGFDWISPVSSRPYIVGANFTRSSVNLGFSLCGSADPTVKSRRRYILTEFLRWNNYSWWWGGEREL